MSKHHQSYSAYLSGLHGEINQDLRHYLKANGGFINQLHHSGYKLFIENGGLVQIITYASKADLEDTITQRVFLNKYFMCKGEDTRILLFEGLAYRCTETFEQLKSKYVLQQIQDLELQKKFTYSRVSAVQALRLKYFQTEPLFADYLSKCSAFLEPLLQEKLEQGMKVKANCIKSNEMAMYQLKDQYKLFAQEPHKLSVIINGKLVLLPLQLIGTHCLKTYTFVHESGIQAEQSEILFTAPGMASVHDMFLPAYYNKMG